MVNSRTAHAKINLNLHVIDQDTNGYHQLQSVVVFAEIGDKLTIVPSKSNALTILGPFAKSLNNATSNLVTDALNLFRKTWPTAIPNPLAISLTKNLPIASGIGGGSADAAAMLKLLQGNSMVAVSDADLVPLAQILGADVPICLNQRPTLMQGKGEKLTPLRAMPKLFVVLINPLISVSTPNIFTALTEKKNSEFEAPPEQFSSVMHLVDWLKQTRNDLYKPAKELVPEIGKIVDGLKTDKACLLARMSGSGATVFGLFETEHAAASAARKLGKVWPDYWCVSTGILDAEGVA